MRILVTGGAGFIGSHLIDMLLDQGHFVVCVDDLSLGRIENIRHHESKSDFKFVETDILSSDYELVFKEHEIDHVFHLAANSDIQKSAKYPSVDLNKTFQTTFLTLENMRRYNVEQIVFASSSAVYGELNVLLQENVGPLFPISLYGAAKLSSEAFISAFAENYGIKAWIFRFPNVVGERLTHGVIYDFINKLRENPRRLEILGDGSQSKPYLYVKDLVEGMIFGWKNSHDKLNYFNLGVDSTTSVTDIAKIVVEEMGLAGVEFVYTSGDRGWVGDVPSFQYDLSKINRLGWRAKRSSDESVRLAVKAELALNG